MDETLIKLNNISKSFDVVPVLKNISFSIQKGTIYALTGENGAGKSTICNIISGNEKPSSGTLEYGGKTFSAFTIAQAREIGIRMVHQELQVLPLMTIEENIFIGDELAKHGIPDKISMRKRAKELLEKVGLNADPENNVSDLSIAGRQLVEIARAINHKASLIILDEPTSSLSKNEISKFFSVIRGLREKGVSFLFISHRLDEIFNLADVIIVLKDGKKISETEMSKITEDQVIQQMVGRKYSDFYNRERTCFGKPIFEVVDISGTREGLINNAYIPQNVSFQLREGEILGVFGLMGAGRTELIKLIFGELPKRSGRILIDGKTVPIKNSRAAVRHGMAWVPEDRKQDGLILDESISFNISLPILRKHSKALFVNDHEINAVSSDYVEKLSVKATGIGQTLKNLSGGNQQKVVIGKWLSTTPKILVLDEPTRGIDIGAKAEIYKLMNQLTAQGIAILLISSELPEIMGISDRILIMYEGRLTGELTRKEFSEPLIMKYATGRRVKHDEE